MSCYNNNNKSVLIVDDEYDFVNLIKKSLEMEGRKTSAFTDPFMALEDFKVNCKDCNLIMSDIRMPGMNGYELIRKAKEIDKQVKVILLSAFEIQDKEFHNMLPDIKVDAFLQKPFSKQDLSNVIQKLTTKAD